MFPNIDLESNLLGGWSSALVHPGLNSRGVPLLNCEIPEAWDCDIPLCIYSAWGSPELPETLSPP